MFQPISHVQIEVWGLFTGGRALAKWHAHWRTPQHCHLYMCLYMIAVRLQPWQAIFNGMAHPKKLEPVETLRTAIPFDPFLSISPVPRGFLGFKRCGSRCPQVSSDKAKETEQQCQVKAEKETMECRLKLDLNWLNWLVLWMFFSFSSIVGMMIQSD